SSGLSGLNFKSEQMPEHFCHHISPIEHITENYKMSLPEIPVQVFINNSGALQQVDIREVVAMYIADYGNTVGVFVSLFMIGLSQENFSQIVIAESQVKFPAESAEVFRPDELFN